MPRKASLTKAEFDALPKEQQSDYRAVPNTQVYVFDLEPANGYDIADLAPIRTALSDRTEQLRVAKARLEAIGETPADEIKAALEFKKTHNPEKYTTKEALAAATEELKKVHAAELVKKDTEVKRLNTSISSILLDKEVARLCSEKDTEASFDLIIHPIRSRTRVDVDEKTGQHVVRVLDDHGNPRTSLEAGKTYADIKDYMLELKKDPRFMPAFKDTMRGGSGGGGGGAGGAASGYTLSAADARDPIKYKAAQDAAVKAGQQFPTIVP